MKVDRAAMMECLESCAVLLDNDLVECCRRLPCRFKYRNGTRKYLLKQTKVPLLLREVLTRGKKGFGIPTVRWLRTMPVLGFSREGPNLIDVEAIERRWAKHRGGQADQRIGDMKLGRVTAIDVEQTT
jgi:asparagine synthase (glutamine-hydrolysing)